MEYRALTIGLSDELLSGIQTVLTSTGLHLTPSVTVWDASGLLNQEIFHLSIVDLEYLRSTGQSEWLAGVQFYSSDSTSSAEVCWRVQIAYADETEQDIVSYQDYLFDRLAELLFALLEYLASETAEFDDDFEER